MTTAHTPIYLDTSSTVDAFFASIASTPILALDTEGASFHRFVDRIYLLQLSTREKTAIIDPLPVDKPAGLGALLEDPKVEIVFDATKIFPTAGRILALGVKTSGGALTQRNVLARIDPNHNRVEGITSLPSGQLVATTGKGSLWVARVGQSTVERLDPRTGRVLTRFRAQVGTALAVLGGHLWTSSAGGVVRQVR